MIDRNEYKNIERERIVPPNEQVMEETKEKRPLVLHCGITAPTYSSVAISEGFRQNGFDVSYYNWQSVRFDEGLEGMRERLILKSKFDNPNIIFLHVQNPDAIDKETAIELSKHAFVINYTFDVRSKEKTEWMYELAPLIGLTVFACQDDANEAISRGINNVTHSHSSFDPEVYRPLILPEQIKSQYPKIVFIGNNTLNTNLNFEQSNERVDMVEFLKKQYGDKFGVYGMGWENSKMVNPQEKVTIYNACKIAITQNQFKRKYYASDRQWEIMSCGTFSLCQHYEGIEKDFVKEVHCDWWNNLDELKNLIDFYLFDDKERESIAKNGSLFVRENHNWKNRIEQILSSIPKNA